MAWSVTVFALLGFSSCQAQLAWLLTFLLWCENPVTARQYDQLYLVHAASLADDLRVVQPFALPPSQPFVFCAVLLAQYWSRPQPCLSGSALKPLLQSPRITCGVLCTARSAKQTVAHGLVSDSVCLAGFLKLPGTACLASYVSFVMWEPSHSPAVPPAIYIYIYIYRYIHLHIIYNMYIYIYIYTFHTYVMYILYIYIYIYTHA